ncbi:MAG: winged helix-turn-helix transcriptional regulator [Nitrospirae bacterium]|nr:winged helix-turn-helix transcriptional regulator [Nitrospirota bacterium]
MKTIEQKIELLRVIANPVRIKILMELGSGIRCAGDFLKLLDLSQPNISQHLSVLRNHKIVDYYMDHKQRCYFVTEPMVSEVIELLNKDFPETTPRPGLCEIHSNSQ